MRFFGWDLERWAKRAAKYSELMEKPLEYSGEDHPLIQERNHQAQRLLWMGKVAYAHRQTDIREHLFVDAQAHFENIHPSLSKMKDGTDAGVIYECV